MSLSLHDSPPCSLVDPKVYRDEEENGVCRSLFHYAIHRSGDSYDENMSVCGWSVRWYYTGVTDSFTNAIVFLQPDAVPFEAISFVANEFLPRNCSVPLYSFSFFAKEEWQIMRDSNGAECGEWRPTNPAIRHAQKVFTTHKDKEGVSLEVKEGVRWKWTRYPIMVRTLRDCEEDIRTTFTEREELEVVPVNPDVNAHLAAFEQICSSAFEYEYSEDLIRLHTRCHVTDPRHQNDVYEKFLLRHKPTDEYIGLVSYSHDGLPSNPVVLLAEVAVRSDHKRKGYGAYMVKYIMRLLRRSERQRYTHLILDATEEGKDLYKKLGFEDVEGYGVYRFCSLAEDES